jgi:serine/threonine protein kinase
LKSGKIVAVKILSKGKMDNKDLEQQMMEIAIMRACQSEQTGQIFDEFETDETIYIVVELI